MIKRYKHIPFIFVLVFNYWIWEILKQNLVIGILLLIITGSIYATLNSKKRHNFILLSLLVILFALQFETTQRNYPWDLSPLERDTQIKRMNSYVTTSPRLGYYLEMRKESIVLYKLQNNLTHLFDVNYYFFGSYPRSVQIPGEFEKLPFIYFPIFLIGVIRLYKTHKKHVMAYLVLTTILISFIGDRSHVGLIASFPWLIISTAKGAIKLT